MALTDHDLRGVPTRTAEQVAQSHTQASAPTASVEAGGVAKKQGKQGRRG